MNARLLIALAAGIALAADAPKEEAVRKELERFQGAWQLVSAETDGKQAPEEQVKMIKVVIKGSKHTVFFGEEPIVKDTPFMIDPTKKPKQSTDTLPDGKEIRGIYELDGDTLKSCVGGIGKERPTEFTAKAGTGQTLQVFKRVKP